MGRLQGRDQEPLGAALPNPSRAATAVFLCLHALAEARPRAGAPARSSSGSVRESGWNGGGRSAASACRQIKAGTLHRGAISPHAGRRSPLSQRSPHSRQVSRNVMHKPKRWKEGLKLHAVQGKGDMGAEAVRPG